MKKIFLSLSAIALLAVGTVSCGSDDGGSAPGPGPGPGPEELTENYFDVAGDQTEAGTSRWYVRTLGSTGDSPIREYVLSETDETKYALFDLITWSEDDSQLINVVYAVEIDESVPADSQTANRYYYPYTSETFETVILSAYHVVGDNSYEFGQDFQISVSALDYSADKMTYVAKGTANNKFVEVNFNGLAESLYVMDDTPQGRSAKSVKPNFNFDKSKFSNVKINK